MTCPTPKPGGENSRSITLPIAPPRISPIPTAHHPVRARAAATRLVAEGALSLSSSGRVATPALTNERIEELASLRAMLEPELASRALPRAHFALIDRRLRQMGSHYGALPAHDGLWEAARETAGDALARLAIVPMVLEARGLDVTPSTLERVRAQGDENGARILQRILDDEIRHVAVGSKHFHAVCAERDEKPRESWQKLVEMHFSGVLKGPFNDSARLAGGLPRDFYAALA